MITLYFVGDGERDAAMLPALVRTIVRADFASTAHRWAHIRDCARGFGRKLEFASRQAKDLGAKGVVAVVDRDKSKKGERLRKLKKAQQDIHSKPSNVRVAVGEAVPHGEAWLLDDAIAVRTALGLSAETPVKSVLKCSSPKDALEGLAELSPHEGLPIKEWWARIAENVRRDRCQCAKETGFVAFVDDVKTYLCPLFAA